MGFLEMGRSEICLAEDNFISLVVIGESKCDMSFVLSLNLSNEMMMSVNVCGNLL
jgi:hypothetical protein